MIPAYNCIKMCSPAFGREDINIPEISYLLQLLHHFLDAQIAAVAHFVFHLSQPITELFILVIEDGPGIEAVCDFLPAQGHLGGVKVVKVALSNFAHMMPGGEIFEKYECRV